MEVRTAPQPTAKTPLTKDAWIGRRTSIALIATFLATIVAPPVHQLVTELREKGEWRFLSLFEETPTSASLKAFGESLARDSVLAARTRTAYQRFLTNALGLGSEKVLIGRDGFLFYRGEVDMARGPGFLNRRVVHVRGIADGGSVSGPTSDPVDAVIDYHRQLRDRGVRLVVAPLPIKPFIYPEKLWPGYPPDAGPAWNADRGAFLEKLRGAGVDVVDVTDDLWRAKSSGEVLFLRGDTHWSPAGLRVVAGRLAEHIRPLLGASGELAFGGRPQRVTGFGDLVRMLEESPEGNPFPPETVEVTQVFEGDGIARGQNRSPALLLGDSYINIFSRGELDWGEGAGLGEQLMLELGVGIQVIAVNGGGATGSRQMLARKPEALAEKKVVLWAFSARDLFDPSIVWERVPLP